MARNKTRSLAGKKFFSMVVLSVAALGLLVTTMAVQQQTSTESEATGDKSGSLINCNIKNGRSGGIQIFNGPKLTGGSRVLCVKMETRLTKSVQQDKHLDVRHVTSNKYYDIWDFNNKMESYVLKANRFCHIQAEFYGKTNFGNFMFKSPIVGGMVVDHAVEREFRWINKDFRNKISSIKLTTECALDKYGYTNFR